MDGQELPELVAEQLRPALVGGDLDRDAGDRRVVGGAYRKGVDVVSLAGEKTGHLAEDAGGVLDQHGQRMQFDRFGFHSSFQVLVEVGW